MGKTCISILVLQGLFTAALCALFYGPCHDVTKVDLDIKKWEGEYYVNVMTYNTGVRCIWVNRTLQYEGGEMPVHHNRKNTLIGEVFTRIENGTEVVSSVQGNYAGKGHYTISKEVTPGDVITFQAYWLHFDLPNLDCHYVCTDDERLKNGHGAFWCESIYPDALKENACEIKKIAKKNGFSLEDLMVVDNCDCPNIPYPQGPSQCETPTIEEYFAHCK